MIRPAVKSITSYKFDFASEAPSNPYDFEEWIEIDIETSGSDDRPSESGDEFRSCVITPSRFAAKVTSESIVWGRPFLVVERWDPSRIHRAVAEAVANCWAPSYEEVVALLARFLWIDLYDADPRR